MKKFFKEWYASAPRHVKKLLRDAALMLYDDLEFKAMSLPRVLAAVFGLAALITWAGCMWWDKKVDILNAMLGGFGAGVLGYIGKKYSDTKKSTKGEDGQGGEYYDEGH